MPSRQPALSRIAALCWGCGLLFLSGCGESSSSPAGSGASQTTASSHDKSGGAGERVRVAVSAIGLQNPMTYGRGRALERLIRQRAGTDPQLMEAGGSATRQAAQLFELISKPPKVLVVFPEEIDPIAGALTSVLHSGIKVIIVGRDVPPNLCSTCVFVDQHQVGELAGQFVVQALTKKARAEGLGAPVGRVVEITGAAGAWITRQRSAGFIEALSKEPGIVLVHQAPADWDPKAARDRIAEALRLQKRFDVVFAHDDFMGQAVHRALKELQPTLREQVLILSAGGNLGKGGGMEMITRSELDACVYNPPLVDIVWKLIQNLLDDPNFVPKPRYQAQPFIVTPEKAPELLRTGVPTPAL